MTALMGRATKATIRAEVTERKALSFKPVIEIGEEGRMQSFLYRLQPGYFKNVCSTCHQKNEEGKDCTFCAEADANMKRDIEARRRNAEQRKLRKQAERQREKSSAPDSSAQDMSRDTAMEAIMKGRHSRSAQAQQSRAAKKIGNKFTPDGRRICDFFAKDGNCRNKDKCAFAHVHIFIPPQVGESGNDLT